MVEREQQAAEASRPPGPGSILGIVLLVGFFGAVSGTHVLQLLAGHGSFLTTAQIERLVPGQSLAAVPIPAGSLAVHERVGRLALIGGTPWMLALTLISGLVAGAALVRVLHPGLAADLRSQRVARWRLVVALAATAAVLVAALWELPEQVMRTTFPATRAALAGGLLWLVWHRRGWLHAADEPPGLLTILGQLICGGAVGLVAHKFLRHTVSYADLRVLGAWLEYGYWSPVTWRELALYSIGLHFWGGLLAGTLAALLGQSNTRLSARLIRVALPAALVLSGVMAGEAWRRGQWQGRFHLDAPLETLLPLPAGPPGAVPERAVVLLDEPGPPLPVALSPGLSVLGLPVTPRVDQACQRFLSRPSDAQSAAGKAHIQLYDSASWRWDPASELAVALAQLRGASPRPIFGAVLMEQLGHVAWSPSAQATVDALLASSGFTWTDRLRAEALGRLAWRWGRWATVSDRVSRSAPESARSLARQAPPRHDGKLTGRLTLAGKPLAGVRVGLVAERNSQPLRPPRGVLQPWPQRLISAAATTDSEGRFRLEQLFRGDYRLILQLEPARLMPLGQGIAAYGRSGAVTVGGSPVNLGSIDLRAWRPARPTVEAALPGQPRRLGGAV